MPRPLRKTLLTAALAATLAAAASAQTGAVRISGILRDGWHPITASLVQLYAQGTLLTVANTDPQGRFDLELETGQQYQIVFAAYGYVSKRITVDTRDAARQDRNWDYWFNIDLFPEIDDVDFGVFNLPVARVSYSENWDEFDLDNEYTNRLQKLTAPFATLVRRERKAQYDRHAAEARAAGEAGDLVAVIDSYTLASACDPYSDYPATRIAQAQKELSQISDDYTHYAEWLRQGDSCLLAHAFGKAAVFYAEAADTYPHSLLAAHRRDLADTLASRFDNTLFRRQRYNQLVADADAAMQNRDYATARAQYAAADEISPDDEYVFRQLQYLDTHFPASDNSNAARLYRRDIDQADASLARADLADAYDRYTQALGHAPGDPYCLIQLRRIEEQLPNGVDLPIRPRSDAYLRALTATHSRGVTRELRRHGETMVWLTIVNDGTAAREYIKVASPDGEHTHYRNGIQITPAAYADEAVR